MHKCIRVNSTCSSKVRQVLSRKGRRKRKCVRVRTRARGFGEIWLAALVLLSRMRCFLALFLLLPHASSPISRPWSTLVDTRCCTPLEALVFAADFIANLAASPGQVGDGTLPVAVSFTTTIQLLEPTGAIAAGTAGAAAAVLALVLLLLLSILAAASAAAAAAHARLAESPDQRQLR